MQTCPLYDALYAASVRQTEVLPIAVLLNLYIRLPSDSAPRRSPLPSANSAYCQVCSGLSPPSRCPCRAHQLIKSHRLATTGFSLWRRRRDSNPRTAFNDYTISNRARSTSYATSPYTIFIMSAPEKRHSKQRLITIQQIIRKVKLFF